MFLATQMASGRGDDELREREIGSEEVRPPHLHQEQEQIPVSGGSLAGAALGCGVAVAGWDAMTAAGATRSWRKSWENTIREET